MTGTIEFEIYVAGLDAATALTGAELIVLVQNGAPVRTTVSGILNSDLPATFSTYGSGKGVWMTGNQTPVAGSAMQVDNQLQVATLNTLTAEAGAWPGGNTYSFVGINKEFNASGPTGSGAPFAAVFAMTTNNGSGADVVGIIADAIAQTGADTVFGANFIARNQAGTHGAKLVGLEIDLEPASGTTISGSSAGLFINAFSINTGVPAIQTGGVGGGTFGNGIAIGNVAGAGLSVVTGNTMASLVDASNGTFGTAAVIIGNAQKFQLNGTSTTPAYISNDGSNNLNIQAGTGSLYIKGNDSTIIAEFKNTASSANFTGFFGGTTGFGPTIFADGADTNAFLYLTSKGNKPLYLATGGAVGGGGSVAQFEVLHTASANNIIQVTGSNGGNPTIFTSAGHMNLSPASGKTLIISSLPTSAAGLPTGALWNNSNVVNVV